MILEELLAARKRAKKAFYESCQCKTKYFFLPFFSAFLQERKTSVSSVASHDPRPWRRRKIPWRSQCWMEDSGTSKTADAAETLTIWALVHRELWGVRISRFHQHCQGWPWRCLPTQCMVSQAKLQPHCLLLCNRWFQQPAGATVGVLPCLDISSSVTAFGRTMIDHTKQMVEADSESNTWISWTFVVISLWYWTAAHFNSPAAKMTVRKWNSAQCVGELLHWKRLCPWCPSHLWRHGLCSLDHLIFTHQQIKSRKVCFLFRFVSFSCCKLQSEVMVKFGVDDVAEAMRLGQEAAETRLMGCTSFTGSLLSQILPRLSRGHGERHFYQAH